MFRIRSIRNISTHWRATCNFTTAGVNYRDYWRVSLESLDLLVEGNTAFCCFSELANVRGYGCPNCTILVGYYKDEALHVDSWYGNAFRCEFQARTGGVKSEDNFRYYKAFNPAFRCTSTMSSTTEIWLGHF